MTSPKIECPECQSDKISSDGVCLDCGGKIREPVSEPVVETGEREVKENPIPSGAIEMDYSEGPQEHAAEDNIPQWRKELSERLKAIKEKKETAKASAEKAEASTPPPPAGPRPRAAASRADFQPKPVVRKSVQHSGQKPAPIPRQKPLQPLEDAEKKASSKSIDPHEIQKLIDNAVSMQSGAGEAAGSGAEGFGTAADRFVDHEGKLILLSRTVSGFVDLFFVLLCTVVFIICVDLFSGFIKIDNVSYFLFLILFLMNYFVYSLFFLISSNQTIGMMTRDLRVVSADRKPLTISQLVYRCCGHLISLFGLGIGLLLSLFSRENLCFHDRFSGTRVIRT